MKRWRTSRVDVDSKGNPCLERMMSVLVEGGEVINDRGVQAIIESANDSNLGQNEVTSMDDMKDCFRAIGGTIWENAVLTSIM
jgi:Ca2+-binding EF-hand superfamily protein